MIAAPPFEGAVHVITEVAFASEAASDVGALGTVRGVAVSAEVIDPVPATFFAATRK